MHSKIFKHSLEKTEHHRPRTAFLSYFRHLHDDKKYKPSTIWNRYSEIGACYNILLGKKLKDFPLIQRLLRNYDKESTPKKAKAFSLQEIRMIVSHLVHGVYWQVRKAAVVVAFCGGLRLVEFRSLVLENVEKEDDTGYWVTFMGAKDVSIKYCNQ